MGYAVKVRNDYTSAELRGLAKRSRDARQARRLLSIAAVVDGASRTEAAKVGGMDRQTLRDWVHRFNEEGPYGLVNHKAPGATPKLTTAQRARLVALVEQGPIPAIHEVVRWRACDLMQWIYEEFGVSLSDSAVYRILDEEGFSYVSARPKARKQDEEALAAFKKTSSTRWLKSVARSAPEHPSKSGSRTR